MLPTLKTIWFSNPKSQDKFSDDKVETKRRPGPFFSNNRETNDKRNSSYTLSTINNIFHGKVEVILNKNSCYFIQELDLRFSG